MTAPSHKGRTAQEIISEHVYHDAQGFGYRAASWIDLAKREKAFAAFHYACIDGRLCIEHLIFEQLVISAGESLNVDAYERCLAGPPKLDKLLAQLVPDYDKLQEFTIIVGSINPGSPSVARWKIKELRKSWGRLSHFLHWSGAPESTENASWQENAILEVEGIIGPLWQKIRSEHSGVIRPDTMPPAERLVWEDFCTGKINGESARVRLQIVRPAANKGHA
jgi:hypothetical protein